MPPLVPSNDTLTHERLGCIRNKPARVPALSTSARVEPTPVRSGSAAADRNPYSTTAKVGSFPDGSRSPDRECFAVMDELRGRTRAVTIAVAVIVGIAALYGCLGLLIDAQRLGARDSWLDGSPFPNFIVPGLVLGVVIGGGALTTAAMAARRTRLARPAAFAMGLTLLAWGLVETLTIGYRGIPQVVLIALFVAGPALLFLGVGWRASLGYLPRDNASRPGRDRGVPGCRATAPDQLPARPQPLQVARASQEAFTPRERRRSAAKSR